MTLLIRPYLRTDHQQVRRLHNVALQAAGAHAGNGQWDEDLNRIKDDYEQREGDRFRYGYLQLIGEGRRSELLMPTPSR